MAEGPAPGSGRGEDPAGCGTPGGTPGNGDHTGGQRSRSARKLARGFADGGPLDRALPGPGLTRILDQVSGRARRCEGAGDDEVAGMLGRWEATEAWCAAAKLGVITALIRRRAMPGYEPDRPGGLPGAWQEGLTQEVSNQLGVSLRAADALIGLAATLETRLVLTREALAGGVISVAKARIIAEATAVLDDARAAAAETLIAGQLAGKTPGQVAALIARAVVTVDPDGARKRRSTWCVTVTDTEGHAIAHGCAKPARGRRKPGQATPRDGPRFSFTPAGNPGPEGGYGTWHLTIAGQPRTVALIPIPIPVTECDHRYETAGYRPGRRLRHLVEVRDGQCTQPTCVRAARRCDFEHAVPWDKGGRTCGCNGGCRCRRDHRIKQSPGWTVTQPMPGYHQWTTPAGRTYTTEPMRYPI